MTIYFYKISHLLPLQRSVRIFLPHKRCGLRIAYMYQHWLYGLINNFCMKLWRNNSSTPKLQGQFEIASSVEARTIFISAERLHLDSVGYYRFLTLNSWEVEGKHSCMDSIPLLCYFCVICEFAYTCFYQPYTHCKAICVQSPRRLSMPATAIVAHPRC